MELLKTVEIPPAKMADLQHSLGPTCAYHEDEANEVTGDSSSPSKIRAQFFYISSLPIDDPLSPVPPTTTDKNSKQPPQPFSARDNAALEEAWQGFQKKEESRSRSRPKTGKGLFSFPKFKEGVKSPRPGSPTTEESKAFPPKDTPMTKEHNKLPKSDPRSETSKIGPEALVPVEAVSKPKATTVMLSQDADSTSISNKLVKQEELQCEDESHFDVPSQLPKQKRHLSPFRSKAKKEVRGQAQAQALLSSSTDGAGDPIQT